MWDLIGTPTEVESVHRHYTCTCVGTSVLIPIGAPTRIVFCQLYVRKKNIKANTCGEMRHIYFIKNTTKS